MEDIKNLVENCFHLFDLIFKTLDELKKLEMENEQESEKYNTLKLQLKSLTIEEARIFKLFKNDNYVPFFTALCDVKSESEILKNISPEIINKASIKRFTRNIGKVITKYYKSLDVKQLLPHFVLKIETGGVIDLFIIEEMNREVLIQLNSMINDERFKSIRMRLINDKYSLLEVFGNMENPELLTENEKENLKTFKEKYKKNIDPQKDKFIYIEANHLINLLLSREEHNFLGEDNIYNSLLEHAKLKALLTLMNPMERNEELNDLLNFPYSLNANGKELVLNAFKEIDKEFSNKLYDDIKNDNFINSLLNYFMRN